MRYPMPNFPCEYEIPDDWITESGFTNFTSSDLAYRSTDDAQLIKLREIEPLPRFRTSPKDWHGFERARLVEVLKGIVAGDTIPPVPVIQLLDSDHLVRLSYRYCVRDGFHRYYASIAAGFACLPASVIKLDDLIEQSRQLGFRQ